MNPLRLFMNVLKTRAKRSKTELKPRAEQLDDRAVPAMMGLGFGGLAAPTFGGGFGGIRGSAISVAGNNPFGLRSGPAGFNRFAAFNTPTSAFNRPAGGFGGLGFAGSRFPGFTANPTPTSPFNPGGFISTTTTPSGPAGLSSFGFGF